MGENDIEICRKILRNDMLKISANGIFLWRGGGEILRNSHGPHPRLGMLFLHYRNWIMEEYSIGAA